MKRKQATLLTLVGVSALGLLAMVVGTHGRQLIPSFAEPTNYNRYLGPTEFEEDCVFENYAFGGKNDSKKFKCELRDAVTKEKDGKYMEGAILYGDCDHQSVGNNLSEFFELDNAKQPGENNGDFHILFSAKGITYANFSFEIALDQAIARDLNFQYSVKFTNRCSSGLYDGLIGKTYSDVTAGANEDGFYNAGGDSPSSKLISGQQILEKSLAVEPTSGKGANAVAFQVNPWSLPAGCKVTVTLKSVTIRYTC